MKSPLRRASIVLLLAWVLHVGGSAVAEEQPTVWDAAAEEVVSAQERGADDEIAALAARNSPDPFVVAELLCARSASAAEAFAAALAQTADKPDVRRLAAYVAARVATPASASELAQFRASAVEHDDDQWQALLARGPGSADTVVDVALDMRRGDALRATDDLGAAADAYGAAARRARRIGWLVTARDGFFGSAVALQRVRRHDDALAAFQALAEVEQERERPSSEAQARFLQGTLRTELGQYPAALEQLELARDIYGRLDKPDLVARVLRMQSIAYRRMGEHSRALVTVERGLELAQTPPRRMRLLQELGSVRMLIGEYDAAVDAYEQALDIARSQKQEAWITQLLVNVGTTRTLTGDYDGSRAALSAALASYEQLADQPSIATVLLNLGFLELTCGNAATSHALCERALVVAHETEDPWLIASAEQNVAEALEGLGKHDDAVKRFGVAAAQAEALGARRAVLECQFGVARCELARDDPEDALRAATVAIAQLGAIVGGLAEGQESEARARHAGLFEVAAEAALALGRPAALAEVLETGRAMALLESLEGRDRLRDLAIPAEHRAGEAAARAALTAANHAHQLAVTDGLREEIRLRRIDLRDATVRLDDVVARMRRAAKGRVGLVYPQADDLATLQSHLGDGDAFVLYGSTRTAYIALVIEKEGARIAALGSREEVDAACRDIQSTMSDTGAKAESALSRLRTLVVAPLALGPGTKRLLISPVGQLHVVPLAALVGDRDVAYVPSGTTYGVLRSAGAPRGTSILALGAVDYTTHSGLAMLPATAQEAKSIGQIVLLGAGATEAALRKSLATRPRWRAVHFACHGLIDMDRPMHTALALTKETPDDGLLSVIEIFTMKVPADLVVLSACESGRGRIYRAEGILGLTRAFMYADAPRVICSLWKVDDEATRELMTRFYALWSPQQGQAQGEGQTRGIPAAAALRQAQAHVRSQPRWKSPYYWAPWVLWGLPE